jgi:hypothetical protein
MVKLGVGRHFALGSKYPSTFFFLKTWENFTKYFVKKVHIGLSLG